MLTKPKVIPLNQYYESCWSNLKKHDEFFTKTLLYDNDKFELSCNEFVMSSTIEFIVSTERFSNSLLWIFIFKQSFLSHNLTGTWTLDSKIF